MFRAFAAATRCIKEAMIRFRINNTNMDNLRFVLVASLGLVMLMLWQEWEKDYGTPVAQAEVSELENREARPVDVPAAPAAPETQQSISNIELKSSTPTSTEGYIVVRTDLYQINIGKKGGGVDKLELLKFPVELDTPDVPTLLLNNTSPLFYVAQGGLLSENGGPTHEAMFTTASDNYILSDTEDRLIVPLVWEAENGIKVTKTYEFNRDSYLVNIKYEIENQSTELWVGHAYSQLQRSDPGRESRILYTYTGAVVSSPEQRYEKLSFGDMEDEKSLDNISFTKSGISYADFQHLLST